jgi:hypothetical protein
MPMASLGKIPSLPVLEPELDPAEAGFDAARLERIGRHHRKRGCRRPQRAEAALKLACRTWITGRE